MVGVVFIFIGCSSSRSNLFCIFKQEKGLEGFVVAAKKLKLKNIKYKILKIKKNIKSKKK